MRPNSIVTISALLVVVLSIATISRAGSLGQGYGNLVQYQPGHKSVDYYTRPKYAYSYGVNDYTTGDVKSAREERDGHVVVGSYSVLQADGIMRTVTYTADPWHGFQAQVHNDGPAYIPKAAPVVVKPVVAVVPEYGHQDGAYANAHPH